MSLNPDFGPNSSLFPALPLIKTPAIEQQVFTHRSLHARPTHIFEDHPDDPSPDNEKLEHLGDTVLGLSVTSLMLEMFPGLRVGPATKIRARIVGNATLAEISLKYKLPDRLRLHPAQAITLRASTHIQADVFEAFVGGLYSDQGLEAVGNWLNPLFRPYVIAAYNDIRQHYRLPAVLPTPNQSPRLAPLNCLETNETLSTTTVGHLALFNQLLQRSNQQVEWDYRDEELMENGKGNSISGVPGIQMPRGTRTTPIWFVRVKVNGEVYGKGSGNTKKAARNEAAKEGLEKLGVVV